LILKILTVIIKNNNLTHYIKQINDVREETTL